MGFKGYTHSDYYEECKRNSSCILLGITAKYQGVVVQQTWCRVDGQGIDYRPAVVSQLEPGSRRAVDMANNRSVFQALVYHSTFFTQPAVSLSNVLNQNILR